NGSLNAGLCPEPNSRLPQGLDPAEAAKARHAAAVLHKLRLQKDRLLVAELLGLALELTGYDATILAEFLGPRKGANIQKLLEQARALDASSPGDLPAFITQLTEFVTHAPKEALAATQAQGAGVIRIMTIHYAKGLEFPLVVIPDLARPRHAGNAEPVLDPELGPLVPLSEAAGSVGFDVYRWLDAVEDLEERKRLLYVALTRAADYLILSSSIDDLDCPSGDWLSLIDARICLADGSLRGELPPGYGTPQVRVIRERPTLASERKGASHGVDLHRLVTKTRSLASGAVDPIPRDALPIPPDLGARRRFSFSTLTGLIAPADWLETDAEGLPAQVSDRGQPGDEDSADPEAAGWGAAGWEGPAGGPAEAEALRERPAGDVVPGETAGGREFGKLVHAILEQVDLRTAGDIGALAGWLAPRFALPEPDHAIAEAVAVVERFLQTPVGVQLASAKIVRREVEFLLPWPPGETPQRRGGRYLQGYLDCLAQGADGRWRLFDYKTNRATPRQVPAVVAHYELQMLAYRLACEAALGEPLAECTLVLLHTGGTHSYAWDEAAERRGVARITAAMDQMSAPAGTV
ncbi:MAG TPA: 3'-5' exonuclease, partial [Lacipirellulaceae bacterium]|nr:3'-5' exonuclease [Lacipirellulaceae bacterium]